MFKKWRKNWQKSWKIAIKYVREFLNGQYDKDRSTVGQFRNPVHRRADAQYRHDR